MLASGVVAATARRMLAARPRWEALVGAATGAAAFVSSVALSHAGFGASEPGSRELDWIGGLLIACSTVPLVAWRRAPRAVFALTASASALLGALGYPIGLPLGPTAALYLLAASRDEEDPWTRRDTGAVVALFLAILSATAYGQGGFPGGELFHTSVDFAVAWFAGERTRLRRQRIAALRERALVAEREGERERRLAVAEERPGSPATSTTPPATPSTSSRCGPAAPGCGRTPSAPRRRSKQSRSWRARRPARSTRSSARFATTARRAEPWTRQPGSRRSTRSSHATPPQGST